MSGNDNEARPEADLSRRGDEEDDEEEEEGKRVGGEERRREAGGWPGARWWVIILARDEYRHPRGFHHRNMYVIPCITSMAPIKSKLNIILKKIIMLTR